MGRRERLARRRKALGLSQEDLAALLAVERSTVARWERGVTEPASWLRPKLARALRLSADGLAELLDDGGAAGPATSPAVVVPRQLPAAVPDFTGRAAELETLTRVLDEGGAPGTVVISAIGGTAGVGKTALALYWAHQVAGQFPDGQLHVNLRGFDPSGTPVAAAQAIRVFVDALGVPPERIPADPDAQAGLFRSLVADRRMLIMLDNARDEDQVRPLLPASPASLVLVTSRNSLAGLAATDGARLLSLDVLAHDEAVRLLTARIGQARTAAEPAAIAEIAGLCACLPLALAVAAARASARPGLPLSMLAAELRNAAGRLDALDVGDPATSVRAVFSWSYAQLSGAAARMFRLLGQRSGPDISVPATASLGGIAEPEARRLLRELARAHLITEHVPGRYALHDLLRAYAADQSRGIDSESDRAAATVRLLDHYLYTAYAAALLLEPWRTPMRLAPLSPGAVPEPLADKPQAMTWFEAEHDVLLAVMAQAAGSGFDRHAWQLPWTMSEYLHRRGRWHERVAVFNTGLAAASRLGDTAGRAVFHRLLGYAYSRVGDYRQADIHTRHSMELYQGLGDSRGEANARMTLAAIEEGQGHYAGALGHCEQALQLFRALNHTSGEAKVLNNLGWYHALLGDYQQAREFCQRSLALNAELGDRQNEGYVWDTLGYAEHHLGNFSEAAACYRSALGIFRELGNRFNEAATLSNLGDTRHAAGELPRAREAWQEALAIFDDLEHPDASKVRAKLAGR